MEKNIAEETSLLALKVSSTLDNHLKKLQETCSKDEFEIMRKGIGLVMGYLYTDVMEPLWSMHPELRPNEMSGPYKVPPEVYRGY